MRNDNDEELRKALEEADPADKESLRDWSESEAGRRVLARILARREEEPEPSHRRWPTSRVALATLAAIVVVVVVVVGVVVGTRGSSGEVVESTTTSGLVSSTTTTVAPQEGVESLVALAGVVRLTEAIRGSTGPQLPLSPQDDPAPYLDRAESLGIVLPGEYDGALSTETVSRGTYALWIWRAFGDQLPPAREVDLVDLGTLSEEMQEAVVRVADAGILDVRVDGRFAPDEPLTAAEEHEAFERLEQALGLVKDAAPGS